MKKALSQISKSPFTRGIEKVKLPRRFHQPTFTMYNGRSPPHAESINVHHQSELHNFEHGNHVDNQQEGSSQTIHAGRSGYQRRSHLVHE